MKVGEVKDGKARVRIENRIFAALAIVAACTCCKSVTREDTAPLAKESYRIEKNGIDTIHLRKVPFSRETVSNGILRGARRAELRFAAAGEVASVEVKNGSRVKKGDIIARLNTQALTLDKERARQSLDKSLLDLYDALFWFAFAVGTISGLLFSLLALVFVMPVFVRLQ